MVKTKMTACLLAAWRLELV
jgi:hypothetical protein